LRPGEAKAVPVDGLGHRRIHRSGYSLTPKLRWAGPNGRRQISVCLRIPAGGVGDARAISSRDLVSDPFDLPGGIGAAEHQDRARFLAGTDRDVGGSWRRVQVVPLSHPPLLALHDGDALAAEHEESLLRCLHVVIAVGFVGLQHVDVDRNARHLTLRRLLGLSFLHSASSSLGRAE
jgi:hypothetical protein